LVVWVETKDKFMKHLIGLKWLYRLTRFVVVFVNPFKVISGLLTILAC